MTWENVWNLIKAFLTIIIDGFKTVWEMGAPVRILLIAVGIAFILTLIKIIFRKITKKGR